MARRRLDRELVARGLAEDLTEARRTIEEQRVLVDGSSIVKPSTLVSATAVLEIAGSMGRFASRAGMKLDSCLDELRIEVEGRSCLDAGAGSGGFTDCLLRRGGRSVTAVDVGYGQFDWRLRNDPRVRLMERTNLRTVDVSALGGSFEVIVADLSFISLTSVLEQLVRVAAPGADMVLLVKPQFEADKADVGAGGVVHDREVWRKVLRRVSEAVSALGWEVAGLTASRLLGAEGNQEFFIWARRGARIATRWTDLVDRAIGDAP